MERKIKNSYATIHTWICSQGTQALNERNRRRGHDAIDENDPYLMATIRATQLPDSADATQDEMNLLFHSVVAGRLQWIAGEGIKDNKGIPFLQLARHALSYNSYIGSFEKMPLFEKYKLLFE